MSKVACNINNGIYQDIGNIIESEEIADNEVAESIWFSNYYWIRKWLFKIKANGQHEVIIYRKNMNDIEDEGTVITQNGGSGTNYYSIEYEGVTGYQFKIGIKNLSGSNLTVEGHLEVFRNA